MLRIRNITQLYKGRWFRHRKRTVDSINTQIETTSRTTSTVPAKLQFEMKGTTQKCQTKYAKERKIKSAPWSMINYNKR